MTLKKLLPFSVLFVTSSPFLMADAGWYGGLSTAVADYQEAGMRDLEINTLQAQIGHRVNDNLAMELRLGVGVGDDSNIESAMGQSIEVKLEANYLVSGFVKGILPLGMVDVYALAGFTTLDLSVEATNLNTNATASLDDDGSDVSYGAGLSFKPTEQSSIFLEYINFYDDSSVEVTGYTLGFNLSF